MWRVEEVCRIGAELQVQALFDSERPEQAEVHIHAPWPEERVAAHIAVSSGSGNGNKGSWVIELVA